jgi:hypothetical protein
MRQGCSFFPFSFNVLLYFPAMTRKQGKEINGIKMGKDKVKLSLFAGDLTPYLKILMTPPLLAIRYDTLAK